MSNKTGANLFTKLYVLATLAMVCVITTVHAQPSEKAAALFSNAESERSAVRLPVDSDILKRRLARVNLGNLTGQTRIGGKIQLNLFEDLSFDGIVQKVEDRTAKNYTMSGHLGDDKLSTFALSVVEEAVAMNVRTSKGELYEIHYLQNGLHEIRQVNPTKFPECDVKAEHAVKNPAAAADAPVAQGDAGDLIDVMIVYTPAARIAAGSSNAIHAKINLSISGANTAFQESQINTRFRLVYAGEVAYTEADFNTDLNRITSTSDGFLDEVHGLRNTYGADLVSLWIEDGSSCGLAWLMTTLSSSFASSGFSVVAQSCATGNFSFVHELAHNMGCTHNREDSGGQGLYSYSYGWRFTGTNSVNYRTIMAYNGSPSSTRIARFSNPNVSYFGTPTGVTVGQVNESHNAQTINNSAFTVANFRQTAVSTNTAPSILDQPQPQHVAPGATATFSVTASGTLPLYYLWRRAGTNIGAATTSSSFSITNVQPSHTNIYSVVVSNAFGTVVSSNAALTIAVQISLAEALDTTGVTWTTGGTSNWTGQTTTTHDGIDAAQSGLITHLQQSWSETTFTGPGVLTYWCKTSSEAGWDLLRFYVNGVQQGTTLSGEVDWVQRTINLGAGNQICRWTYNKDGSDNAGQDKVWVDQVNFVPAGGISLSVALDNSGFTWVTGGNSVWAGQSATTQDGTDAAQSGVISHNGFTSLQTEIVGPGSLSFWWKVSSETDFDPLAFFIDGNFESQISGEVNWTSKTVSIPEGTHTLTWQYSKDVSDTMGLDKGWVDQIVYSAGSSFLPGATRTNGQFQFQFNGLAGASYTLQASTNLVHWATLTNLVSSSNTSHIFMDTSATNFGNRFYKIVSP